ncbi:MAG: four helix bundle protein [Clostridia bacterium]|nr:four helix bundle protein [Clostridia bacterium]
MKNDNLILNKTFDFAVRIVNLYKYVYDTKREPILSRQILRSGTSIGANVHEAEKAQTLADFYSKMSISLKEANETSYWLKLLYKTEYITESEFVSLQQDLNEIIGILTAICKSTQKKIKSTKK